MKIGIIGLGWVGSSVAISTLHAGFASEVLLNDIQPALAEGEAMDLAHGAPFYAPARVGTAAVEEMNDCDAVVICAGRGGKPGESRLDLLADNARIVTGLGRALRGCRGNVVLVSNPVDVLTQLFAEASGLPLARVIGTGTMLDTARLRQVLGSELAVDPRSVHGQVLGEHGDSEVVIWSGAQVGGRPLRSWPGWEPAREQRIADTVRSAAREIIRRKGATNHAIGLVTAALLRSMLRGERRVLTVSRVQEGGMGLREVALSLPAVVGPDGAREVIEPALEPAERELLARSAEVLRRARASLEEKLGAGAA